MFKQLAADGVCKKEISVRVIRSECIQCNWLHPFIHFVIEFILEHIIFFHLPFG